MEKSYEKQWGGAGIRDPFDWIGGSDEIGGSQEISGDAIGIDGGSILEKQI